MTRSTLRLCFLPLELALSLGLPFIAATPAHAQATFPIGFAVDTYAIERVPPELKFQARISQARMPVGEGQFPKLVVKLKSNGNEVCSQEFANVSVKDSVLNLDINSLECTGSNQQPVAVDEAIAQYANLELQVCVGDGNCLASVALGSVPYAMKSSFAVQAHEARMAEVAAQAHYAHRVTADLEMLTTSELGTGYFDFVTPDAGYVPGTSDIYTDYSPHFDEGFVSWAPVSVVPSARRLNLCAKDDLGNLVDLDGLVIHAATTTIGGALEVESTSKLNGSVVANAGISVSAGDVDVEAGNISVPAGLVSVGPAGEVAIHQAGVDAPAGQVSAAMVSASDTLHGATHLYVGTAPQNPSQSSDMVVNAPASFAGKVSVGAASAPGQLTVEGDLLVGSGAAGENPAVQELVVNATSRFLGPASFENEAANVSFEGPATFGKPVSFSDSVSFESDTAPVTFHGPVSFEKPVSLPGGIAVPNGSVTNASLVDGAVDSRTIAEGTILPADLHPSVLRLLKNLEWQTWSVSAYTGDTYLYDITYGDGRWVAVGASGAIYTSTDGDHWSAADSGTTVALRNVTYSPAAGWMALGQGSYLSDTALYECAIARSSNGTWWTSAITAVNGACRAVAHDGVGRWVLATYKSLYTSTDGTQWDEVDLSNVTFGSVGWIAYGNGTWVAVGRGSDFAQILASPDGIEWTTQMGSATEPGSFNYVAFGGDGQFVAVSNHALFTSPNGTTWTKIFSFGGAYVVSYGSGSWVIPYYNSSLVSSDGVAWESASIPVNRLASDGAGNWVGTSYERILRRTSVSGL